MKLIKRLLCMVPVFLFCISFSFSQSDIKEKGLEAITLDAIKGQVEFLASDWTEGRETGKKGCFMAADYIASMFKVYGLKPAGDFIWTMPTRAQRREGIIPEQYQTYFQEFSLIEYSPGEDQLFSVTTNTGEAKQAINFVYRTDFTVSTSNVGSELSSAVVFVGYGFVDEENNYNDFKDIDVRGKVILRLSGYPGHMDPSSAAYEKFHPENPYAEYYLNREKNSFAVEQGAIAIIEINLDNDPTLSWATNVPFRYNERMYEGEEPLRSRYSRMSMPGKKLNLDLNTIRVTNRVANELIRGTSVNYEEFEKYALEKMKPNSKELSGKSVYLKTSVNSKIIKARNVLGMIEGKDTENIIVMGGHYDHLGMYKGFIWNGSDDNASGTVGVMTLAKAFMATGEKPEKTLVFAAWTAEEKGLIGSRYFVENPIKPIENIKLSLNFDMISRQGPDDPEGIVFTMRYTQAYPQLQELMTINNDAYNMGLEFDFIASERPSGGSDFASFAAKDIPVMSFNAGFPVEYHQADDHASDANFEKMLKIVKLGFLTITDFSKED